MTAEIDVPLSASGQDRGRQTDVRPKVRISTYGGTFKAGGGLGITLEGLDEAELNYMKGALHGHQWVTCRDGRIEQMPTYEPLPAPDQDQMMLPFWRRPVMEVETQMSLFSFEPLSAHASPSITIQHLCGYNYSPEKYRFQAAQLQRWGFECLRSRRDDAGEFHEIWYLPGLWAAKGELKAAVDALDPYLSLKGSVEDFLRESMSRKKKKPAAPMSPEKKQEKGLDVAISFLCRFASFGTLDVSVQRAAMGVD